MSKPATPYTTPLGANKPAPKPHPEVPWRERASTRVMLGMVMLALSAMVVVGIALLARQTWERLKVNPNYPITRLELETQSPLVPVERVQKIVEGTLRGNFFSANMGAVREALLALPWVEDATVARRWPNRLVVTITPYTAFAKTPDGHFVNPEGILFQGYEPDLGDVVHNLPILTAPEDKMSQVVSMYRLISDALSPLGVRIVELDYSDRGAWSWVMMGETIPKTTVRLGQESDEARIREQLAQLINVYPEIRRRMGGAPTRLDLRYQQGIAASRPSQLDGQTSPSSMP